ncbi:MAG: hypothetical protein JXB62_22335, partial [Pirellulales bacterium]|nr:hypothetical protein [Pirellulales bacterium]
KPAAETVRPMTCLKGNSEKIIARRAERELEFFRKVEKSRGSPPHRHASKPKLEARNTTAQE